MKSPFSPAIICLLLPLAAHGTTVTTATDEDDGSLGGGTGTSLREAVKYSPAGTAITFAPALSGATIRLALGEITIAQSLTIDGSTLPQKITLSGDKTGDGRTADDSRVLRVNAGTVILDSLIITAGNCPATQGAGIYVNNNLTKLTVRNTVLTENNALDGAGIYFSGLLNTPDSFLWIEESIFTGNTATSEGGAIRIFGRLLIFDSSFVANTATNGGAIYLRDGTSKVENTTFFGNIASDEGGAIWNYRTFALTDSTISENSAPRGGGIFGFNGTLTVEASTLSGNSASGFGGGIHASGSLDLTNSTVAGNFAGTSGGGIYCNILTAKLQNATISANSAASTTGGIYFNPRSSLGLNNSIVAGNSAPTASNLSGTYSGANNLAVGNPLLAPLGDYGGPTWSMPPLPGSPAIDMGGVTSLTIDQRGFSRISTPDIGAAEFQGASDIARFWNLDFDGDGSPYGTEQALGTDPLVSDPGNPSNLTVPALDASGHAHLSFGLAPAAAGTCWVLSRSTDLLTFSEIYRYDGITDTAMPGITFLRTASDVTVADTNPPPGGGFYRFEACFDP